MEDPKELILWLKKFKRELSIQVIESDWPKIEELNLCGIRVSGVFNDQIVDGFSLSQEKRSSVVKAVGEFLERCGMLHMGYLHSNAMAFHVDLDRAKENAKMELIERTMVVSSFYRDSFVPITNDNENVISLEKKLRLKHPNLKFDYISAGIFDGVNVIACLISGHKFDPPFGFCFGFGASASILEAIQKAQLESINTFANLFYEAKSRIEHNRLDYSSLLNVEKSWSLDYASFFENKIGSKNREIIFNSQSDFQFNEIYASELFPESPVPGFVVQAKNEHCIEFQGSFDDQFFRTNNSVLKSLGVTRWQLDRNNNFTPPF